MYVRILLLETILKPDAAFSLESAPLVCVGPLVPPCGGGGVDKLPPFLEAKAATVDRERSKQ